MRCLSVCLSRSWFMSKRINISSKFFHHRVATPFVFPYQTGWRYSDGNPLRGGGGVECRWGGENAILDEYLASLHTGLRCCQVVNRVAGGRRPPSPKLWHIPRSKRDVDCWRRRRNVYDKKPRRHAEDNRTAHLTARSDKSVAYVM